MATFGPWVGVPREKQRVCAVEGCEREGEERRCTYDGSFHHHGCVHYGCERAQEQAKNLGLVFRRGWGLLCKEHGDMLDKAEVEWEQSRKERLH